jgi:hypothetical protein
MKTTKRYLVMLTVCSLVGVAFANASRLAPDDAIKAIADAVARPIPSRESIAGSSPPFSKESSIPKLIVVAGFSDGERGLVTARSEALAYFAAASLQGVCEKLAISPAYYARRDLRGGFQEPDQSAAVVRARAISRMGPRYLLTGSIRDVSATIQVRLSLVDTSNSTETVFHESTSATTGIELPLANGLEAFASAFCDNARLTAEEAGTLDDVQNVHRLYRAGNSTQLLAATSELLKRRHASHIAALLHVDALWWANPDASSIPLLRGLIERFPNSDAIQLLGNYVLILQSPRQSDAVSLDALRARYAKRPNDFATVLALLDLYRVEQIMYHSPQGAYGTTQVISGAVDHHEGVARALRLGMDLIALYPRHYKSWFHTGMAVSKYGGLVRGTKFWSNLSEDQRVRDRSTKKVAGALIAHARALHPDEPWIHEELIGLAPTLNEERMDSFRRAVALSPKSPEIYQTAYNFATPQWGGRRSDRKEIFAASLKHNADAGWPKKLQRIWAPDLSSFWRIDNSAMWITLLMIGAALAGVAIYLTRSTRV